MNCARDKRLQIKILESFGIDGRGVDAGLQRARSAVVNLHRNSSRTCVAYGVLFAPTFFK